MQFFVTASFTKSLRLLDPPMQKQIQQKLTFFADQDNPMLYAKKLRGYDDIYRFRSGDYRIVFRLADHQITLLLVKHRKDIYEGL